ncbi:MAG TPA: hypothetical protein VIH99_01705 [Bdellovibrionota bacterium]|jgi:hypothetical protein
MEPHGIQPTDGRKEITCADCGHRYLIAQGQRSGACQVCGNVAFLTDSQLSQLSQEIVAKRVLPRLVEVEKSQDPLTPFRNTPDGHAVEEVQMRYQVEWQLWAALVQRFHDPVYHMAYICQAMASQEIERASERYREHRSVMALADDSRWQADVADLMLGRIEQISLVRLESQRVGYGLGLPEWLSLLPFQTNLIKAGWVAIGLFLLAKLLHFQP